jgi:P27 family predicted phage terminase small subunit
MTECRIRCVPNPGCHGFSRFAICVRSSDNACTYAPAAQGENEGNPGHRSHPRPTRLRGLGDIGKPPTLLDKDAKSKYRRLTAALADLDMLGATDVGVAASNAVAYSRWFATEKKIAAQGAVLKVEGSQGQIKPLKHSTGRCAELHRRPRTPVASLKSRVLL